MGIFQAGYAEIDSQIKNAPDPERAGEKRAYRISSVPALERTLRRAVNVELQGVTRWLGFLATTAAAAPFIGLFGTVWGIMQAFNDIGATAHSHRYTGHGQLLAELDPWGGRNVLTVGGEASYRITYTGGINGSGNQSATYGAVELIGGHSRVIQVGPVFGKNVPSLSLR